MLAVAAQLIVTPAAQADGGHPRVTRACLDLQPGVAAGRRPGRRPGGRLVLDVGSAAAGTHDQVPGAGLGVALATSARPSVTRAAAPATVPGTRHAHRGGIR